jgi:Domain of unknown function (DUF4276)
MIQRVLVLVEGQTEETFVKKILNPEMESRGLLLKATCICTKTVDGRRQFRGGHGGRYDLIRRDILRLLGDTAAVAVTSMLDYYGLPGDFPGHGSRPPGTCFHQAQHLERSWQEEIGDARFIPNLTVHEFEGLLFSSPESINAVFPDEDKLLELTSIADAFGTPEEINDNKQTAPSRRLASLFPAYQKPLHGRLIAQRATLTVIRGRCNHFNNWLQKIEGLSEAGSPAQRK